MEIPLSPLDEIAQLSTSLVTKPEYKTKENLEKLYALCKNKDLDISTKAIKSVALVLISILPSYAVGKHAENENLSKEVRQRRQLEQVQLEFARRFNQFCEHAAFNRSNPMKLRCASAVALSNLYAKCSKYNTSDHLAKCVVRLANCTEPKLRNLACGSIRQVFENDIKGQNTLQILTNVATTPTNKISVELLQTLEHVKLKSHFDTKPKQPKIEDKELEKELKEADLVVDDSQHERNQMVILEHLFGTVFRFLKETKSEQHYLAAMAVVHSYIDYINISIIPDILSALKQKQFSLRAAITSATTAISVCKAANLTFDLRDFYSSVYARCYEALDNRDALFELLNLFDFIGNEIDITRTKSFAKRLMTMSIHALPPIATAVLAHIRKLFSEKVDKDPSIASACYFSFEGEGEFNIDVDDPVTCGGDSAKYWELSLLSHTYEPILNNLAIEMASLNSAVAIREADIAAARERKTFTAESLKNMVEDDELKSISNIAIDNIPLPTKFKKFEF